MEVLECTAIVVGYVDYLDHDKIVKLISAELDKNAKDLNLIDDNIFAFCWIVDYPMFEIDEKTKKIKFSHNPFSMPQVDEKDLDLSKPLNIKALLGNIGKVCSISNLTSSSL